MLLKVKRIRRFFCGNVALAHNKLNFAFLAFSHAHFRDVNELQVSLSTRQHHHKTLISTDHARHIIEEVAQIATDAKESCCSKLSFWHSVLT